MKNVLLIGPKHFLSDVAERSDLPCKLLVINDGFKALVGLLKLAKTNKRVDGIYLHDESTRAEVPAYVEMIRALERGLKIEATPICLAVDDTTAWQGSELTQLEITVKPSGENLSEDLVQQLTRFVSRLGD